MGRKAGESQKSDSPGYPGLSPRPLDSRILASPHPVPKPLPAPDPGPLASWALPPLLASGALLSRVELCGGDRACLASFWAPPHTPPPRANNDPASFRL